METTKIITSTKNLVAALEQVEKIIDTKSSNYLLRSAFIQAEDGKMKISANNLEVIGCKTINCIADDKIMFALEDVKRVIKALKYFKGCDTIITFESDKACNFEDGKKSFKAGITDVNDNDAHSLFLHTLEKFGLIILIQIIQTFLSSTHTPLRSLWSVIIQSVMLYT